MHNVHPYFPSQIWEKCGHYTQQNIVLEPPSTNKQATITSQMQAH